MEKHLTFAAEYLVICKPSHVHNTGLYKCEAENVMGEDSSEGYLNVLGLYNKPELSFVNGGPLKHAF